MVVDQCEKESSAVLLDHCLEKKIQCQWIKVRKKTNWRWWISGCKKFGRGGKMRRKRNFGGGGSGAKEDRSKKFGDGGFSGRGSRWLIGSLLFRRGKKQWKATSATFPQPPQRRKEENRGFLELSGIFSFLFFFPFSSVLTNKYFVSEQKREDPDNGEEGGLGVLLVSWFVCFPDLSFLFSIR